MGQISTIIFVISEKIAYKSEVFSQERNNRKNTRIITFESNLIPVNGNKNFFEKKGKVTKNK